MPVFAKLEKWMKINTRRLSTWVAECLWPNATFQCIGKPRAYTPCTLQWMLVAEKRWKLSMHLHSTFLLLTHLFASLKFCVWIPLRRCHFSCCWRFHYLFKSHSKVQTRTQWPQNWCVLTKWHWYCRRRRRRPHFWHPDEYICLCHHNHNASDFVIFVFYLFYLIHLVRSATAFFGEKKNV